MLDSANLLFKRRILDMAETIRVLLSSEDIERIYGIKQVTLAKWRYLSKGPSYFKVHGMVRYKTAELERWLETKRVKPI